MIVPDITMHGVTAHTVYSIYALTILCILYGTTRVDNDIHDKIFFSHRIIITHFTIIMNTMNVLQESK